MFHKTHEANKAVNIKDTRENEKKLMTCKIVKYDDVIPHCKSSAMFIIIYWIHDVKLLLLYRCTPGGHKKPFFSGINNK